MAAPRGGSGGNGSALNQFTGIVGDMEGAVISRGQAAQRSRRGGAGVGGGGYKQRGFAGASRGGGICSSRVGVLVVAGGSFLLGFWALLVFRFVVDNPGAKDGPESKPDTPSLGEKAPIPPLETLQQLVALGNRSPAELARLLSSSDPFGVLMAHPDDFQCPKAPSPALAVQGGVAQAVASSTANDHLLAEPRDKQALRNREAERGFREGKGFIYFQHLRKAGGTGFCDLASRNMAKSEVPRYYCMPDNKGAMATPPWSEPAYLVDTLKGKGHRITSNEWDAFPASHLSMAPPDAGGAVFATSMRDPVERWYSQYRFEHLEGRDGSNKKEGDLTPKRPFGKWYRGIRPGSMGDNYYVKTFNGLENPPKEELMKMKAPNGKLKVEQSLYWSYHKFGPWKEHVRWEDFLSAVQVMHHFNVILILEFIDHSVPMLNTLLGWHEKPQQVLPHEKQASREVKKSRKARENMDDEEWKLITESNAFDTLFYHWTRRIYLERRNCQQQQ